MRWGVVRSMVMVLMQATMTFAQAFVKNYLSNTIYVKYLCFTNVIYFDNYR